ncbi:MAG TPA: TetR/AcrR family transcriptional regulator, partial [Acidimicrobiales bacterium]
GDLRPTAPRLAARAGVSVRSVFQHFEDLSALHIAVARRVAERVSVLLVELDTSLPLAERTAAFVRHRAALLEALTPFRRAADVHGPFSPDIRAAVRDGTSYLRREVEATFAPELDRLDPAERAGVLDALAAATSWAAWNALRADAGATEDEARAAVARTVSALLATAGRIPPAGVS